MTYTIPLPLVNLLSPAFRKTVRFSATAKGYRHRARAAISSGFPLAHETYDLVYPVLTDSELALVEATLRTQDKDVRISWTPPTQEVAEFLPPIKWQLKRIRLAAPTDPWPCASPTGLAIPQPFPVPDLAFRNRLEFSLERYTWVHPVVP